MRYIIVVLSFVGLVACAPVKKAPAPVVVAPPPPPKVVKPDAMSLLAKQVRPERDQIRERHRYDRAIKPVALKGTRYYFYEPNRIESVVGFSFQNTGSPRINPIGQRKPGARREYAFHFADRAREDIHLAINDDVNISGRFSHDNMFRELHFFPRRQLPSMRWNAGKGLVEVTLPTSEQVWFDSKTKEVVGGVLDERPIDFNHSRHHRHNPLVRYSGQYLAISVAQRGEAPRRARIWGRNKLAEIQYPAKYAKPCLISPRHIWDQRPEPGDSDPTLNMLHATDESLFTMIEQQCRWDLSALRTPPHNWVAKTQR